MRGSPNGIYASHFHVRLAFLLGHVRKVHSLRKIRAFLELLVSKPFGAAVFTNQTVKKGF